MSYLHIFWNIGLKITASLNVVCQIMTDAAEMTVCPASSRCTCYRPQCLKKWDGIFILWNILHRLNNLITGFLETRACLIYFGSNY